MIHRHHKSDHRNHDVIMSVLRRIQPDCILEIGIGYGEYGELILSALPKVSLIGVEIFKPYLSSPQATLYPYEYIITKDILLVPDRYWNDVDLTLWIDGPEHVVKDDAIKQLRRAARLSTHGVLFSCPIGEYPQGARNNNEHERHLSTFELEDMDLLGAERISVNDLTGVFWLK